MTPREGLRLQHSFGAVARPPHVVVGGLQSPGEDFRQGLVVDDVQDSRSRTRDTGWLLQNS
ncbi:MAG TPA: hypothetical protein VJH87_22385 [Vicinamibacteria bacterium]|nr:hypothetical protein [Vicinamibacteria bacterium]